MSDELQQARELFTRYSGSHIQMHREGVLKMYKEHGISRETEQQWLTELADAYLQQLSIRNWEAVQALDGLSRQYQSPVMVEKTAAFAERNIMSADSLVRLMYAEGLTGIIRCHKPVIPRELLFRACRCTVEILEAVMREPLVADPGHELQQLGLRDKRSLNLRAKKGIEEIEELLN
ncbi:hypothetical protein R70723_22805 [Paenibacillus sp. FSL R7-0273]|uniref:hypothetical protein n=1 Tax=Paenibacillus sp. FSL R7-0273 TaxID=1536772 RepID=UPI0004F7D95B|nr:hypothetical protein [Paenibacillus sp. FSL R7-0273]AIQ48429.1 hypothetical protein R70723_22805 [Paenibacillus sp. FSL R7-0273]OMF88423.1 hypothetical protein BK144_21520 [Paenibacillus sp. FSL R7-0273]